MGHFGVPRPPAVPSWNLSSIYQRLSDVLYIRSGRHDQSLKLATYRRHDHAREPRNRRPGDRQASIFFDIAFAIDKAFGIKLPLEKWTQEVNDGKATTEQYFVLKNLSARIDELVAAKGAGA